MQKSAQFQHPAARLYVTYVSHNLPQKQWPRAYDWFCYAAARASTKYSLRIRSLASMYSLRIYGKLHCFSFYNKLLTAHMTTHTIGVLIKKMVCSLWRYPARMQTTPSVAEVLCFTSIDHIHIENITTAWRAGDMRHCGDASCRSCGSMNGYDTGVPRRCGASQAPTRCSWRS